MQVIKGKYERLYDYLVKQSDQKLSLSFDEIETILKAKLPNSAYVHVGVWWSNTSHYHAKSWVNAGYKIYRVENHRVYFKKMDSLEYINLRKTI